MTAPLSPPGQADVQVWVSEYGNDLFRFALSLARDGATAEDLVQETFLAALKSSRNFGGRSTPKTWLMGILRHKALDHFRRVSRERDRAAEEKDLDTFRADGHWESPLASWPRNPEQLLEEEGFRQVFDDCVEALPVRLRSLLVLRTMENRTTEQVCKELGISPTNMWVMLHRARARLRSCLEKNWFVTGQNNEV